MGSTQSAMAQEGQEHHRQKSRQKVACPRDSAIGKAGWLTEEATEEKIKLEMGELLEPELQISRDSRDSRDKKNKSKYCSCFREMSLASGKEWLEKTRFQCEGEDANTLAHGVR